MHSVGEVARKLEVNEPVVRHWIKKLGLGSKVGWAIVLGEDDINKLKERLNGKKNHKQPLAA